MDAERSTWRVFETPVGVLGAAISGAMTLLKIDRFPSLAPRTMRFAIGNDPRRAEIVRITDVHEGSLYSVMRGCGLTDARAWPLAEYVWAVLPAKATALR